MPWKKIDTCDAFYEITCCRKDDKHYATKRKKAQSGRTHSCRGSSISRDVGTRGTRVLANEKYKVELRKGKL